MPPSSISDFHDFSELSLCIPNRGVSCLANIGDYALANRGAYSSYINIYFFSLIANLRLLLDYFLSPTLGRIKIGDDADLYDIIDRLDKL